MFKNVIKLPAFSPYAAGSDFSLRIPVTWTYQNIMIEFSGVTPAQLKNLELRVNGKPLQRYSSAQVLIDINTFHKRSDDATDGVLNFWQIRPELLNMIERQMTALGTADLSTVTLHGEIDAAAAAPVLSAHAEVSKNQPAGLLNHVREYVASFGTTGQLEIDNLPTPARASLAAIHLGKSDISDLEIYVDNRPIWDATKALGEKILKNRNKTSVSARYTHAEFIGKGSLNDSFKFSGVSDFRLKPTLDTSGNINIVVEMLDDATVFMI